MTCVTEEFAEQQPQTVKSIRQNWGKLQRVARSTFNTSRNRRLSYKVRYNTILLAHFQIVRIMSPNELRDSEMQSWEYATHVWPEFRFITLSVWPFLKAKQMLKLSFVASLSGSLWDVINRFQYSGLCWLTTASELHKRCFYFGGSHRNKPPR